MTVDAAVVSASEANRSFSALLRQVAQGRSFTVHSHGRPVAHLTPVSQWGGPLLAARRALRLMRAALDTNLLVYAEGFGDGQRVSAAAWRGAMDLCVAHQLASWDALVLNVAAEGGARMLLTEDLHAGFCWRGVRVVNPLVQPADPLLPQLLS